MVKKLDQTVLNHLQKVARKNLKQFSDWRLEVAAGRPMLILSAQTRKEAEVVLNRNHSQSEERVAARKLLHSFKLEELKKVKTVTEAVVVINATPWHGKAQQLALRKLLSLIKSCKVALETFELVESDEVKDEISKKWEKLSLREISVWKKIDEANWGELCFDSERVTAAFELKIDCLILKELPKKTSYEEMKEFYREMPSANNYVEVVLFKRWMSISKTFEQKRDVFEHALDVVPLEGLLFSCLKSAQNFKQIMGMLDVYDDYDGVEEGILLLLLKVAKTEKELIYAYSKFGYYDMEDTLLKKIAKLYQGSK